MKGVKSIHTETKLCEVSHLVLQVTISCLFNGMFLNAQKLLFFFLRLNRLLTAIINLLGYIFYRAIKLSEKKEVS